MNMSVLVVFDRFAFAGNCLLFMGWICFVVLCLVGFVYVFYLCFLVSLFQFVLLFIWIYVILFY